MTYPALDPTIPWSLVKSGFRKTPHFNTLVQRPAAGRGLSTISLQPYATWDFEVDITKVSGGESVAGSVLQKFLSLYMQTCGGGGFFLFTDPNDNAVAIPNLIPNGNSELGPISGIGGLWVTHLGYEHSGYYCRSVVNAGNTGISPIVPCTPGDNFVFSLYGGTVSPTTEHTAYMYMSWRDGAGAEIGVSPFRYLDLNNAAWYARATVATAPGGAAGVVFALGGMTPGLQYNFDDLQAWKASDAPGVLLNVTPGAASPMGQIGDGTSRTFQFARKIGSGIDILQNLSGVQPYANGLPVTGGGVPIVLDAAPANNSNLTWTGNFQYLCRFTDDTLQDLARVSRNGSGWLWDCPSVKFESVFV